ncbi:hypothetical protein ACFL1G_04680 [Planctomycetota bacterium]
MIADTLRIVFFTAGLKSLTILWKFNSPESLIRSSNPRNSLIVKFIFDESQEQKRQVWRTVQKQQRIDRVKRTNVYTGLAVKEGSEVATENVRI